MKLRKGLFRVGRSSRGLVDECEKGREIVRLHVDLPAHDGGKHDLTGPEVELARYGISVRLEDLAVQLAQDELLAEVGGADGYRGLRSSRRAGTAAGARD